MSDDVREVLAPYLYEAYRLGKYGKQEYMPMWHEMPASEHRVPWAEVYAADAAVEVLIERRIQALVDAFRREADPSTEGVWRDACELLSALAAGEVDDEKFCPVCYAGMTSPQHLVECEASDA